MEDDFLYNFVKTIQAYGYGDIIEGDLEKPIIMPPILNLQRGVERLKENKSPISENILSYLHGVEVYIMVTVLLIVSIVEIGLNNTFVVQNQQTYSILFY